ncbi:MAG: Asp-tRNA(Asn)/Glu-tRNA(Gln) amidotransferase subunit GatB [Saprospirales bacterium]|nr:Asp-tRNA(Asn)/Glu-tRNA(Gln) amidotransferase subunit GatB [Saprospirales bacterium]
MPAYETVIGLEAHVQLTTHSKAFSADPAAFGGAPNTHTSAISLAHPGTLPRLNRRAVGFAVRLGLALDCTINRNSVFERKNYFYADLPKGYQITQGKRPICTGGKIQIKLPNGARKTAHIHQIHLEEDAGKSLHDQRPGVSLIDLNRAGVPLLEIVGEPDLHSADEAAAFMEAIRRLVRWLGISDGNMEEGSLRCDVNVSVRKAGHKALGARCEIKNLNSMRFARRAIEYEAARQADILERGNRIEQQTRGFDAATGATYPLRDKEEVHDYRYFPEPDLPPVILTDAEVEHIRAGLPPLPEALEAAFQTQYGLPAHDADALTQDLATAGYFQVLATGVPQLAKPLANLLIHKLLPWSAGAGTALADCPVSPGQWRRFAGLIQSGRISASAANQRLFPALLSQPGAEPAELAEALHLLQTAGAGELEQLTDAVLARFPDKVAEYRKGKKGLLGFFMGELMKASGGKADPKAAMRVLEEKLSSVGFG